MSPPTPPADGAPSPDSRRLVVLDVDSTVITGEVIEMLAGHAGSREVVAAITESAMRGEMDFAASLHQRVATLAGLPVSVFDTVRLEMHLTPGAERLVAELRLRGWPVGLVSGGFVELVGPLARDLGIDFVRANALEVQDGVLTGRVRGPVVDSAAKAAALREFAAAQGVTMDRTVAIGDGANDLEMLAAAGLGIAYNAKPVVCAQADVAVLDSPLDAVLGVLGLE
ncbi:phosphoserine phosphatase SerB [Actinotalea sp. K2]|uniref:phosphoserine phosphatase SerB n=1 Tax=Actinotalea sp. K2 TaxID=2939438 RepID=UPI002016F528|nr:phosphoserine phosphatase SerB [Actinotalea sp. K2]MCL3861944.1 phosphoserine phosphatase SerB [Actinotalea sp. K2]